MMRKKKRTTTKTLWQSLTAFAAALAMVVSMGFAAGITAEPSHAAGSYEINGTYVTGNFKDYSEGWPADIESLPDQLETTFSLYKVGEYKHDAEGKSIIEFYDAYNNVTLPGPESEYADKNDWIKAWLSAAYTISLKITNDTEKAADDQKANKNNGWEFRFSGLDAGVYLLMGTPSELNIPKETQTTYWRPQPMLIQVFEGSDRDVKVKPEAEIAHKFRITKSWVVDDADKAIEEEFRPESVDVKIYYDRVNNPKPVKTVTLREDSNPSWSYSWQATKERNNPFLWTVEEQALGGEADKWYTYSVDPIGATVENGDVGEADNEKIFKLTNTFEPASLELTKDVKTYLQNSNKVSTTFIFEITGFKMNDENKEEQVYHKYVSLAFDTTGKADKEVKYIPVGLSKLVVSEVQASNYIVDKAEKTYVAPKPSDTGDSEVESESNGITFDGNKYIVEFSNTYDEKPPHYQGGVINKFKLNVNDGKKEFKPDGHEGKRLGDSDKK